MIWYSFFRNKGRGFFSLLFLLLVATFSPAQTKELNRSGAVAYLADPEIADTHRDLLSGSLLSGSLSKLVFAGDNKHYTLNGVALKRVSDTSIVLGTKDGAYKVRATFLKTLRLAKGNAAEPGNQLLLEDWKRGIPLISKIVELRQPIGSLEPVLYEIMKPRNMGVKIREELILLSSSEPEELQRIGEARLMSPVAFPGNGYIVDIQYRGMKHPSKTFVGRALLQILYVQDHSRWEPLAAFVILCKPGGEYEFRTAPVLELLRSSAPNREEDAFGTSDPEGGQ